MPTDLDSDLKKAEGENSPSIAAAVRSAMQSPEAQPEQPQDAAPTVEDVPTFGEGDQDDS